MAFEYNGFIHRDLEPQVRYDAEQVQLLKQADVTINENLQTINESLQTVNTEINGKLTKPTNPTAESAVTMLADGTVGTKLLSEIGGGGGGGSGGGKIYRHDVKLWDNNPYYIYVSIIDSNNGDITMDYIKSYLNTYRAICYEGSTDSGVVMMNYNNSTQKYHIVGATNNNQGSNASYLNFDVYEFFIESQSLTEL